MGPRVWGLPGLGALGLGFGLKSGLGVYFDPKVSKAKDQELFLSSYTQYFP